MEWISTCDQAGVTIQGSHDKEAVAFRVKNDMDPVTTTHDRPEFTLELLGKHIIMMIVQCDLSLSFIDKVAFRNVIFILCKGLRDDQIPHRLTLTEMIKESFALEMHTLLDEFKTSMGNVSFTTDGWSTFTLFPFITIIAHWIQPIPIKDAKLREQMGVNETLVLCSDLIGFYGLLISHTGKHLSATFVSVLNQLQLLKLIGHITGDNTANNNTIMTEIQKKVRSLCIRPDFSAKQCHVQRVFHPRACPLGFMLDGLACACVALLSST
ncbi:hypothetical protein PM082_020050 [Marasmius tenuissimus]|nr:hypothetical protein PM082_020050 [Marasmius tenuissimus]